MFAIRNQGASTKALEIQYRAIILYDQFGLAIDEGIWEVSLRKGGTEEFTYGKAEKGYQIKAYANTYDSATLEDSLPPKEKDPGSFTIPFNINDICFKKSLADLGASVSVMPYSTFTNLDFIVLDMPEDSKVPLILERPFLSTTYTKIDVFKRKTTLRVWDDKTVFKSDKPTSNIIQRVFALGLREQMELYLEDRLMGEALILNRSLDPTYGDYIKLNDLNKPLELRRNQVEDLGPTIKEGEVIDELMEYIVETRNDDNEISKGIDEYPSFCNFNMRIHIDCAYNLQFSCMIGMGDVIVGTPFCREICVKAKRFDGMITIYNGNDGVTYLMARSNRRFKHLTNAQCKKMRPLLKVSAQDKLNGISHLYQKLKSFYKGVLKLGPEYIRDAKIEEWITRGHMSIHEME
ncbi:hypothetical protein Tco_0418345 [Tanacetum coccineum]